MKYFVASAVTGLLFAACSGGHASENYKVTLQMPAEAENATVFLVDYDNGAKIDSAVVQNSQAVFTGHVDEPVIARVIMDGNRMGTFVLENAEMSMEPGGKVNSPLNNVVNDLEARQQTLYEQFMAMGDEPGKEAEKEAIESRYDALADSVMNANADNVVGLYVFLDRAYQYSLDELNAALEKYPQFKKSQRVAGLIDAAEKSSRTAVGQKFVDFEIVNDSTVQRLSDFVGHGKPVLVDFWASWCGPCIRETAVIKDLYNKYGPDGLEVLGVAVWDEPDNTRAAIEKHQIPWPQIINAQSVPTDLYGITGIPHIIIFGPDGTILSRGKQGDDLRADVARLFPARN